MRKYFLKSIFNPGWYNLKVLSTPEVLIDWYNTLLERMCTFSNIQARKWIKFDISETILNFKYA